MCENSSRLIRVPIIVKPVVVPTPRAIIEVQIADVLVAVAVAVLYRMPSLSLPSVRAILRQSSRLYFIWGLTDKSYPSSTLHQVLRFLSSMFRCVLNARSEFGRRKPRDNLQQFSNPSDRRQIRLISKFILINLFRKNNGPTRASSRRAKRQRDKGT